MNFYALAFSVAALFSSASALISFVTPSSGAVWYAAVPNYMQIDSDNSLETSATVRFSSCRQCFSMSVPVNASIPVIIPRYIRDSNYLTIYAISNSLNTATNAVFVANNLPCAPCATPCDRRSRGRCGRLYAEDGSEQADATCYAELKFVDDDSEEAKQMNQEQEQAARDLAEDVAAVDAQLAQEQAQEQSQEQASI
jgi:hypothetical protein